MLMNFVIFLNIKSHQVNPSEAQICENHSVTDLSCIHQQLRAQLNNPVWVDESREQAHYPDESYHPLNASQIAFY